MNDAIPSGFANLPIGNRSNSRHHSQRDGGGRHANQEIGEPSGEEYWHSRGYLPHFESPYRIQHVTWHLADSLPKAALERLVDELKHLPPAKQRIEQRLRVEAWLDAGYGECILRDPEIAGMVQDSLLFFNRERYHMFAWVVMPNHVHTLFQPLDRWTVAKIAASWKKFTARKIFDYWRANGDGRAVRRARRANQEIGEPGELGGETGVWHREYFDRFIRDERHFQNAVNYIHQNPVKAGLVAQEQDWVWSSAWSGRARAANQEIGEPSGEPGSEPSRGEL